MLQVPSPKKEQVTESACGAVSGKFNAALLNGSLNFQTKLTLLTQVRRPPGVGPIAQRAQTLKARSQLDSELIKSHQKMCMPVSQARARAHTHTHVHTHAHTHTHTQERKSACTIFTTKPTLSSPYTSRRYFDWNAAPRPMGMPSPMKAKPPKKLCLSENMCMDPPWPLQMPLHALLAFFFKCAYECMRPAGQTLARGYSINEGKELGAIYHKQQRLLRRFCLERTSLKSLLNTALTGTHQAIFPMRRTGN
eukprot:1160849-Pelagomonas_calceolata.AAC.5